MVRETSVTKPGTLSQSVYWSHAQECAGYLEVCLKAVFQMLRPNKAEKQLLSSELWPRLTTPRLIELLAIRTRYKIPPAWARTLVDLARATLMLQRAYRLLELNMAGDAFLLNKELINQIPDSQDVDIDWLLVQVCLRSGVI